MKTNKFLTVILALSLLLSSAGIYIAGADTVTNYSWNDDFSGETLKTDYKYGYNTQTKIYDGETLNPAYELTEDDTLRVKTSFLNGKASYNYTVADVFAPADRPKMVVSVSAKLEHVNDIFGTRGGGYGLDFIYMTGGKIYNKSGGTVVGSFAANEWVDITCVYDNVEDKKDVYINGEYKGTYALDNNNFRYNYAGRLYLALAFYAGAATRGIEYDNLQIYALPEALSYDSVKANEKGASLYFNMTPDKETLIPANFTVKDESGNAVAVKSVSVDKKDSRWVNLEFDYAPASVYKVSSANTTVGAAESDVIGAALGLSASPELSFATSSMEIPETEYLYEEHYDGSEIPAGGTYNHKGDGITIENGALKITGGSDFFRGVPASAIGGKPHIVMQFKVNPHDIYGSGGAFYTMNQRANNTIALYQYDFRSNGFNSAAIGLKYKLDTWYDVVIVYSGTENKRSIFIDGKYYGSYASETSASFLYPTVDFFQFGFYSLKTTYIDDLMIYALPAGLRYDVVSSDTKSVTLRFNMVPDEATLLPANFKVTDKAGNEITVTSVEIAAGIANGVKINFENELAAFTEYYVSAKNVTSGADDTDVISGALKLGSSDERAFTTGGSSVVPYVNNSTFHYIDFSKSVASEESETGVIANVTDFKKAAAAGATFVNIYNDVISDAYYADGIYKVEKEENGNKYLSLEQATAKTAYWRTSVTKNYLPNAKSYAIEMRVRPHLKVEGKRPLFDVRSAGAYGIPLPALFDEKITFNGYEAGSEIGKYKDGEWITLTTVYHRGIVNDNGTDSVKVQIYADGVLLYDGYTKAIDDLQFLGEGVTGKNMPVTMRVRDYYSKENAGGKVDFDYIKIYTPEETFNAKLAEAEKTSTRKITAVFNSIPEKDAASKISVVDEKGEKVTDVLYCDYQGEMNIGTEYDKKAELVLADELEANKSYMLKVEELSDINGGVMTQYYPFTTGSKEIETEGFTITTREADGKVYATVSVKLLNNTSSASDLKLTIASYTKDDNVETMVNIAETTVKLNVSADGQSFTSDEIEVTGADFVRGFLEKGTKAFIPCKEFGL